MFLRYSYEILSERINPNAGGYIIGGSKGKGEDTGLRYQI